MVGGTTIPSDMDTGSNFAPAPASPTTSSNSTWSQGCKRVLSGRTSDPQESHGTGACSPFRRFGSNRAAVNKDQPRVLVAKGCDRAVVVADNQPAFGSRVVFIARRELLALPVAHHYHGGKRAIVLDAIAELDLFATRVMQHFSIHRFNAAWPAAIQTADRLCLSQVLLNSSRLPAGTDYLRFLGPVKGAAALLCSRGHPRQANAYLTRGY